MHSKAKIAQSTTLHHKVKKIMVRSYKKGKKIPEAVRNCGVSFEKDKMVYSGNDL